MAGAGPLRRRAAAAREHAGAARADLAAGVRDHDGRDDRRSGDARARPGGVRRGAAPRAGAREGLAARAPARRSPSALRDLARPQGAARAAERRRSRCAGVGTRRRALDVGAPRGRERPGPATSSARPPATRLPSSRGPARWRWISRCWGRCGRRRRTRGRRRWASTASPARSRATTLPVYALGGLSAADLPAAIDAGAHGIAAIRGAWPGLPDGVSAARRPATGGDRPCVRPRWRRSRRRPSPRPDRPLPEIRRSARGTPRSPTRRGRRSCSAPSRRAGTPRRRSTRRAHRIADSERRGRPATAPTGCRTRARTRRRGRTPRRGPCRSRRGSGC